MAGQSQPNIGRKDGDVVRDMDLVREILLEIEKERSLDNTQFATFALPDRDAEEVGYAVDLLIKGGLVNGSRNREGLPDARPHGQPPIVSGLTWDGHEFLDNIRDPGVWEQTKERVKPLVSVSLSMLAELAIAEIRKRLGLA